MNNEPEIPHYMPGDTVEMDVEISHRAPMNIVCVEVRFRTEGGEGTNPTELLLTSGLPRPSTEQPESDSMRWSGARVSAVVPMEQASGVYTFFSIIVKTAKTQILLRADEIQLGLFDASLEVVKGGGKPEIISGRFVT